MEICEAKGLWLDTLDSLKKAATQLKSASVRGCYFLCYSLEIKYSWFKTLKQQSLLHFKQGFAGEVVGLLLMHLHSTWGTLKNSENCSGEERVSELHAGWSGAWDQNYVLELLLLSSETGDDELVTF